MSSSRVVARNAIIMYVRMVFLIFISFFTSRELLAALGVEDYGIYSVVGSVAATFISLKSLFAESLQRFLNVEKGKGNIEGQQQIYSIGIIAHVFIAFFFILITGCIGLWLIHYKLVIPEMKLDAAKFVFVMTLLYMFLNILCIPYESVIIANERMDVYAMISIVDGIYKLIVVLLLPYIHFSMLKVFSGLVVLIPLSSFVFLFLYCRRFDECSFNKNINKSMFKDIITLSFWNFFGNLSFSLIHEGINMLLNIFGGLIYNTARTIAYKVSSAAGTLSYNTLVAVRPRVMQNAARSSLEGLFENIILISRLSFFASFVIIIPLWMYAPLLIGLWLKEIPDHTILFVRIILIGSLIRSMHEPLNMMYMTIGKIKKMMIFEAFTMLSFLFFVFIALSNGAPIWMAFVLLAFMELIILVLLSLNAHVMFGFKIILYLKDVLLSSFILTGLSFLFGYLVKTYIKAPNLFLSVTNILLIFLVCVTMVVVGMNKKERLLVQIIINKKS